jgi:uncharacterized membrane protein (Fun14 family)
MGFVGSMAGFLGGYAVGKALKAIARITGVILLAMIYFTHWRGRSRFGKAQQFNITGC